jgi:hypothetical protein
MGLIFTGSGGYRDSAVSALSGVSLYKGRLFSGGRQGCRVYGRLISRGLIGYGWVGYLNPFSDCWESKRLDAFKD